MRSILATLLLCFATAVFTNAAEDGTVTISKDRLKELERKEAELDALKQNNQAASVPHASGASTQPAETLPAARPAVPPLNSLPPLAAGESVDATVLAAHFKQDPSGAAKRYNGKKITVTGLISAFDRPSLRRNYKIVLRAPGADFAITCDFWPGDKYRAVFTENDGTTLVATLQNSARVTLARVGQSVQITGECRGASKGLVKLVGCKMAPATSSPVAN